MRKILGDLTNIQQYERVQQYCNQQCQEYASKETLMLAWRCCRALQYQIYPTIQTISGACIQQFQKFLFTDTLMLAYLGLGYVRTEDLHNIQYIQQYRQLEVQGGPPGPNFQSAAFRASLTSPFGHSGRVTHADVSMMHARMYDAAGILSRTDIRTNEQGDSRSWMMPISMIYDPRS